MKTIVVLGCMLRDCSPTDEMMGRVERAIQFASLVHPDVIIFSGGKTSQECNKSESGAMLDLAIHDLPDETKAVIEEKSRTTVENAVYVRQILEESRFVGDLYIVTSCYHMIRAISIFRTVVPNLTTLSGICYECKVERLQSEASKLIIDREILEKVDWNSPEWLNAYRELTDRK